MQAFGESYFNARKVFWLSENTRRLCIRNRYACLMLCVFFSSLILNVFFGSFLYERFPTGFFYLFQILKIGKNDLLAMEHTLLHLATVPGVTKGVFYFMAVPLEDDTWCVR